ncbi:hypothetical protein HU200_037563 [Digitaria exilis]|uniref:WAT1-related protein n=1 Tax=Digitaria exilis TaxID=1010633 RepID=A0A835BQC5_9POAL|nr:hypothetical protein HU200_037563 [Digitaria exilis]
MHRQCPASSCNAMDEYKPCAAMVVAQCINAAMALWSKAAFTGGMSPLIFVVYRQAIATVVLVPIAIVTNRKKMKDTMGLGIVGFSLVFVASLVGLETVDVRRPSSLAKIFGTAVCVSGAMVMAFFKGPKLLGDLHDALLFHHSPAAAAVPICKSYVDPLTLSAWTCLLSTLQSALLVSFLLPDMDAWRIHSLFEFSCCLFSGVFGSGVMFYLQSWCISVRGPLFSAMFNPLCTVITTVLAAIVLREKLHVGSLLGAIAVIAGLYVVLWGKADDGGKRGTETEHAVDDLEKMTMNRSDSMLDAGEGISEPLLRTDGDLVEK